MSDTLTGLVNDILDYSAIQSPDLAVELQEIDLSTVTQNVVEQFAPLCEQSNCKIETLIEPGQWVGGNEKMLKRVLYNLIDNAVSHANDSCKIKVSLIEAGTVVRVEIRDYGAGIAKDEIPYIWDRYFTSKNRKNFKNKSGKRIANLCIARLKLLNVGGLVEAIAS